MSSSLNFGVGYISPKNHDIFVGQSAAMLLNDVILLAKQKPSVERRETLIQENRYGWPGGILVKGDADQIDRLSQVPSGKSFDGQLKDVEWLPEDSDLQQNEHLLFIPLTGMGGFAVSYCLESRPKSGFLDCCLQRDLVDEEDMRLTEWAAVLLTVIRQAASGREYSALTLVVEDQLDRYELETITELDEETEAAALAELEKLENAEQLKQAHLLRPLMVAVNQDFFEWLRYEIGGTSEEYYFDFQVVIEELRGASIDLDEILRLIDQLAPV